MRKWGCLFMVCLLLFTVGCSDKGEQKDAKNVVTEDEILLPAPMVKVEKDLPGAVIVSIDNHRPARPQSGLDKADRVYEIIAEAGITRFLAIYHSQEAEKIGPVRSARSYFTYIAKGHDAPIAHAGGSAGALNLIQALKIKSLDEIYTAGNAFWRDSSRRMPHNLYTSTQLLVKGAEAKKFSLVPLEPLTQGTVSGGEEVDSIDITYSTDSRYLYTVTYQWDGDRYKRHINGEPHETLEGEQIFTENIIVLAARTRNVVTDQLRSEVDIIGGGQALYFTDGKVYEGKWEKSKAESDFVFLYEDRPMEFKGQHSWINVVPSLNVVEHKQTFIEKQDSPS